MKILPDFLKPKSKKTMPNQSDLNVNFHLLPSFLREGADLFTTNHEKHIFCFSALSACGGLLTRCSGIYYQRRVYPNLFFLLLASAASGKSSLSSVFDLLRPIHQDVMSKSLNDRKLQLLKNDRKEKSTPQPCLKSVIIPGNITSSRLMQHLHANQDYVPSVIIETEMDTLTQANKSDFGGFSDVLRRAWHNEKLSYSRKGNDELIEVDKPKLSLILSGTPKQVFKLIPSAEDGLFSRCAVYSFQQEAKWIDVSPKSGMPDIEAAMKGISENCMKFWDFFKDRDVDFTLEKNQWEILNSYFGTCLEDYASIGGDASLSVIKRSAVLCFKIAMVLTALRSHEFSSQTSTLSCSDTDFDIAMTLTKLSMNCSLSLLEKLPDGEKISHRQERREQFKNALPSKFTRNDAQDLATSMQLSTRSVDRWLQKWVNDGCLILESYGHYKKALK